MNIKCIKKKLNSDGVVDLGEGIFLWTREAIDKDHQEIDFSGHEYWIVVKDSQIQTMIGFDTIYSALEFIRIEKEKRESQKTFLKS